MAPTMTYLLTVLYRDRDTVELVEADHYAIENGMLQFSITRADGTFLTTFTPLDRIRMFTMTPKKAADGA